MRLQFKFLTLAASLVLVVSCSKEVIETEQIGGLIEKTFSVEYGRAESDEATKAFLVNGVTPEWEVGETVSVYDPIQSKGCNFTVQSVKDGIATITGAISAGDYPFSAVYPASAVDSWTDINTVSFSIPEKQTVGSDRCVDASSLISRAYTESPSQGIEFDNQVSLLKFKVETSGITSVTLNLKKSDKSQRSYRIEGAFEIGKFYFASVTPDTYDSGLTAVCSSDFGENWTKSSSNSLQTKLNNVKSLGTVSGGDKSIEYSIISQTSYEDLQAFLETQSFYGNLSDNLKTAIKWLGIAVFPWKYDKLNGFVYTHKSIDPQGNPVTLSAIVYIPDDAISKSYKLNGVVIANHGSIACNDERPSNEADLELMAGWKGYAVILSDYVGFGADAAHHQAYLNPDVAARGNIDAYNAAMQIMKDKGVKVGSKLYNIGYSQGGFNGMANIKYLTEHPELGLKFTKSFLGGGPFDLKATWLDYLSGAYPTAVTFAPITIASINEWEQLGIPYDRLFKGALLDNYQEWIFSKKYRRWQINNLLGTTDISEMLTEETISSEGETNKKILAVCERFSLISGWKPASGNTIYIYHSTQDETVPYSNYTSIKTYFDQVATDCDITYQDGEDGGHMSGAEKWALMVMKNW